jgi:hypothetical protein
VGYMKSRTGLRDGVLAVGKVKVVVCGGLDRMEQVGYLRCVSIGFGYDCGQWLVCNIELMPVPGLWE